MYTHTGKIKELISFLFNGLYISSGRIKVILMSYSMCLNVELWSPNPDVSRT